MVDRIRILGSGGANRAMEAEVKRLAPRALGSIRLPKPIRVDTQTLLYPFDPRFASFAVNYLRTATRVLWDLLEISSERLEPLYDEVKAWIEGARPAWLAAGKTRISVRVPDACEFPASGPQIRGTIKNAIIDGARAHGLEVALDPDDPDVELIVRGRVRPLVLSIDLAGRSMHERGYRREDGEAPLKETVAAQLLILARFDPRKDVLIDPMAGGGTIPIEAALMGIGAPIWTPPRRPLADRIALLGGVLDPGRDLFADAKPVIVANEIHTPAVEAMRRNIGRAGVRDRVLVRHGDFRSLDRRALAKLLAEERLAKWPEGVDGATGLVLANPPYGQRLERGRGTGAELEKVYEDLAAFCRGLGHGWRAAFIIANDTFEPIFERKPAIKKPIWNGSIRAWFLLYEL
jgi:23S rRNA G2445 N2-methylase RlmL